MTPVIRDHLASYLGGALTLDAFYDWLVATTWNIEQRHDPAAEALSYQVKLLIAEHSAGDLTEGELHHALSSLAEEPLSVATGD